MVYKQITVVKLDNQYYIATLGTLLLSANKTITDRRQYLKPFNNEQTNEHLKVASYKLFVYKSYIFNINA